jgi:type I restriction enzyme, S subunit
MKMIVDPRQAVTRFVYYFLRSPVAREYLTSKAHGASSTMKKISKEIVQNTEVPVPPLARQKNCRTTRHGSNRVDAPRIPLQKKLARLDALKKSLLHQAFSGRIEPSLAISRYYMAAL